MSDNEDVRELTASDFDNLRKEQLEKDTGESDPDIARFKATAEATQERERRQLEADIEALKSSQEAKENIRNQQVDGNRVNEVPDREPGTDLAQPVPVAVDALIEEKLGEKDEETQGDTSLEDAARENPEF